MQSDDKSVAFDFLSKFDTPGSRELPRTIALVLAIVSTALAAWFACDLYLVDFVSPRYRVALLATNGVAAILYFAIA